MKLKNYVLMPLAYVFSWAAALVLSAGTHLCSEKDIPA